MIPAIGLIIAAYVFTRMIEVFCKKGDEYSGTRARVVMMLAAVATMAVTVLMSLDLLHGGGPVNTGSVPSMPANLSTAPVPPDTSTLTASSASSTPAVSSLATPNYYQVGAVVPLENSDQSRKIEITLNGTRITNAYDGKAFVANFTLKNTGRSAELVSSSMMFSAIDEEGVSLDQIVTVDDQKGHLDGEILSGKKLRGEIAYNLKGETGRTIELVYEGVTRWKVVLGGKRSTNHSPSTTISEVAASGATTNANVLPARAPGVVEKALQAACRERYPPGNHNDITMLIFNIVPYNSGFFAVTDGSLHGDGEESCVWECPNGYWSLVFEWIDRGWSEPLMRSMFTKNGFSIGMMRKLLNGQFYSFKTWQPVPTRFPAVSR